MAEKQRHQNIYARNKCVKFIVTSEERQGFSSKNNAVFNVQSDFILTEKLFRIERIERSVSLLDYRQNISTTIIIIIKKKYKKGVIS